MELALIVQPDPHRYFRLRHPAPQQLLREVDAPMRDVSIRRQPDLLAKRATQPEFVETRVGGELVERYVAR